MHFARWNSYLKLYLQEELEITGICKILISFHYKDAKVVASPAQHYDVMCETSPALASVLKHILRDKNG